MSLGEEGEGDGEEVTVKEFGNIFDTLDVLNSTGVMRLVKRSIKKRRGERFVVNNL